MPIYYPRKKTVIIATCSVLLVVGTLLYVRPELLSKKNTWINPEIKATKTADQTTIIADISNTDWQKSFISTTTKGFVKTSNGKVVEEKLTLTDQLSRNFFTKYVELKQNNLTGDQKSVENAMDQTLTTALNSAPQPKVYKMSSVLITVNSDPSTIHTYGNNIGTIFSKYGPRANPASIASEALEKDDLTLLENIKPITVAYDKMLKAIIATPVPQVLASYHLDLINAMSSALFVSQGLENISSDPVRGMVSLNLFVASQEATRSTLYNMNSYFRNNGIIFTNTEPGILFITVPQ